jgi:phosphoribosylanthranilate isomerase
MTKLKICGLKTFEDIETVNRIQPDYVGFVFAASKRMVTPDTVKALKSKLSDNIKTVGVFVNPTSDAALKIAEICRLDIIQLHGEETAEICYNIGNERVWKAIRVRDKSSLEIMKYYKTAAILLDKYSGNAQGGTGEVFDWSMVEGIGREKSIVLAGGLNVLNAQNAINIVKPFCIDVSSGVETNGIKDPLKIQTLKDII